MTSHQFCTKTAPNSTDKDKSLQNKDMVINMNILHLKYAVEVEKTSSITKAAENLFMGQLT